MAWCLLNTGRASGVASGQSQGSTRGSAVRSATSLARQRSSAAAVPGASASPRRLHARHQPQQPQVACAERDTTWLS